jgi:heptosyltransferase-2
LNKLIKKILIIRFSSFGDIVLSFPLISIIKTNYPEAVLHFLTLEKYHPLLQLNDNIDLILYSANEIRKELRDYIVKGNYDVIIDLHKNTLSYYCTLFTGTKILRIKKNNLKKLLLVKFKINLLKELIPVFLKYINSCKQYLQLNDNSFRTSKLHFLNDRPVKDKYFIIAPCSRHFTKTYPYERFEQIIKSLPDYKIVLVSDNVDSEINLCRQLAEISNNIINYSGKLNYEVLSNVIYHSELIICNDSGVLHLAEALGKKVICIFGSTVKEFGFYPQLKSSVVFENNSLKCRPCSHIGRNNCPKKHFKCMLDISNSKLISLIKNNLNINEES